MKFIACEGNIAINLEKIIYIELNNKSIIFSDIHNSVSWSFESCAVSKKMYDILMEDNAWNIPIPNVD